MFYFKAVDDIDLDSYAYQLYDDPTGTGEPIESGKNKANIFTISVTNSTDSTPKTYYGRVAVVNSAGIVGTYTSLVSSGATPLIGNQYISSLTAAKITAGTIGAHEITLGGATSIIKSSTYNFASPTTGWFIKGNGEASIGGPNGINFNGSTVAPAITLGSNVTIQAGVAIPNSDGVAFAGLTISTAVGTVGGLQLGTDANNQWLTSGYFRAGNGSKYIEFNPAGSGSFTISSDVTIGSNLASSLITGANVAGNIGGSGITTISGDKISTGIIASAGNTRTINLTTGAINFGNFTVDTAGNATFNGQITSTSGSIGGWLIDGSGLTKTISGSTSSITPAMVILGIANEEVNSRTELQAGRMYMYDQNYYSRVKTSGFEIYEFTAGTTSYFKHFGAQLYGSMDLIGGTLTASAVNAATVTGHVFESTNGIRFPGPRNGTHPNMPSDYNFSLNFQYSNTGGYIYALVNGDNGAVRRITTTAASDRRVKNNITPDVSSQLNKFYSLTPYEFEYNENLPLVGDDKFVPDGKRIVGLIADEVEELFPDYVLGKKETEYQQVDYQDFTKLLIAASIEQNKRIQELSAKVDELESRLV